VVFVVTPRAIRLQRLRAREAMRFGADAVAPGGWRHQKPRSSSIGRRATTMTMA
jgi:hypothetical protein